MLLEIPLDGHRGGGGTCWFLGGKKVGRDLELSVKGRVLSIGDCSSVELVERPPLSIRVTSVLLRALRCKCSSMGTCMPCLLMLCTRELSRRTGNVRDLSFLYKLEFNLSFTSDVSFPHIFFFISLLLYRVSLFLADLCC